MPDLRENSLHRKNSPPTSEGQNLKRLANSLIHRKWLVIFPFFIASSIIILVGVYMSKIYKAGATLLFEPFGVSRDFLKPMLESSMESQVLNLSKQIKSRSQIKQIITEFHLDAGINDPEKLEAMIDGLQDALNVEVIKKEACKISLEGKNPLLITQIINRIATITVESRQKDSVQQSEAATAFLGRELEKIERDLKDQEAKLQEFKQSHLTELPEQKDYNLRMVDRLQMQLQNNEQTLKAAQDQKQTMENRLAGLQPEADKKGPAVSTFNSPSPQPDTVRLNILKEDLIKLKVKYSDEWPDVKKTTLEIAELEKQIESKSQSKSQSQEESTIKTQPEKNTAVNTNPEYLDLSDKIAKSTETIASLKNNQKYLSRQIEEYNRRIENIPNIEQELAKLTDAYNGLKTNHEALQHKRVEAKLSGEFQSASPTGYFRILDSAEVPLNPVRPRMSRVIMMAIFAGLGTGVGLVFLREHMDNSLKSSTETEQFLNLPIIGTIPVIKTAGDIKRTRTKNMTYSIILCIYLISVGLAIVYQRRIESSGVYKMYRGVSSELLFEIEGYTP